MLKNRIFRQKKAITTILLITMGLLTQAGNKEKRNVDPRAWKELDIVPMPKQIQLTGKDLVLLPGKVSMVVGNNKCRQSEIGAEWINKRIKTFGGKPLPVRTVGNAKSAGTRLIIGTANDNPLIKQAVADKILNVGKNNPGERGYEIKSSKSGRDIYLAGADPIGTLYACVTFGEMLAKHNGEVVWKSAEIRDWPDAIYMTMGDAAVGQSAIPELARRIDPKEYMKWFKEIYDEFLRRKVTCIRYSHFTLGNTDERLALVKKGIDYGKERGVGALIYMEGPYVGLKKDHPELWKKMPKAMKSLYGKPYIRSWSMDDTRRETAKKVAAQAAKMGITDVAYHDTDTGRYFNPSQWNDRSEEDRKRWGDDYGRATANKVNICYQEFKKKIPGIRFHFTQYPYNITILDPDYRLRGLKPKKSAGSKKQESVKELRAKCVRFWQGLHKHLPIDVNLTQREAVPRPTGIFREKMIPGRGVLVWDAVTCSVRRRPFFHEGVSWVSSLCHNPHDFIFIAFADTFVPLNSLGIREYSWNTDTPGAVNFRNRVNPESKLFTLIMPRIVRNLFGKEAAPEITAAIAPRRMKGQPWWNTSLQPPQLFTPEDTISRIDMRTKSYIRNSGQMNAQREIAESGAEKLDTVWQKCKKSKNRLGMSDYAFRRFVNMREVFHVCRWFAAIRTQELLAAELAVKDPDAAMAAVDKGLALIPQAKKDLDKLVKERPDDPIIKRNDKKWYSGRVWRAFMADSIRLSGAKQRLKKLKAKILGISFVSGDDLKKLIEESKTVKTLFTDKAPKINGKVNESVWQKAFPAEAFFVEGKKDQLPRASTRVRSIFNKEALFFAATCYVPENQDVKDRDTVEIIINATGIPDDMLNFSVDAAGKIKCLKLPGNRQNNAGKIKAAVCRTKKRWDVEIMLPWSIFRSSAAEHVPSKKTWNIEVVRHAALRKTTEVSSIPPERKKGKIKMASLVFEKGKYFSPDVDVRVKKLGKGFLVLPDGIVTRGFISGLSIASNINLHNVKLTVIGKNYKNEEKSEPLVLLKTNLICRKYHENRGRKAVPFESLVQQAKLDFTIDSDEGKFRKEIKFKNQ